MSLKPGDIVSVLLIHIGMALKIYPRQNLTSTIISLVRPWALAPAAIAQSCLVQRRLDPLPSQWALLAKLHCWLYYYSYTCQAVGTIRSLKPPMMKGYAAAWIIVCSNLHQMQFASLSGNRVRHAFSWDISPYEHVCKVKRMGSNGCRRAIRRRVNARM